MDLTGGSPSTDPTSMDPSTFRDLYATTADPWGLEGSWYEDRKRQCVLAALPEARYANAFEPGCANGALSALLAPRCDRLRCWDVAPEAVAATRARLGDATGVRVEQRSVLDGWPGEPGQPGGPFDLVVVSELVYYFDAVDRARFWRGAVDALAPGGTLLAVHWLRAAPGYPTTGGPVHAELARVPGLAPLAEHVEADFRLDVRVRVPPPARSVAERVGLR